VKGFRLTIIAAMWAAVMVPNTRAQASQASTAIETSNDPTGLHDFDFLVGEWSVHHRRLKPGTGEWVEFEGTCSNRALMDGSANVEEHALGAPSGPYRAVGLRAYDSKARQWAIWWLDQRVPRRPLDPPAKGRFEKGVGSFYSDYVQDGKPVRGRLQWSRITATSAHWEQASSSDAGKTWDTNWVMEFRRAPQVDALRHDLAADAVHDFDFLRGDWKVRHRYLRAATRDWAEVDGTCRNWPLMGGLANLEEHWIDAPAGAYRALALRSYDPKSGRWAIWWLDGRAPHGDLDPPVEGGFAKEVGTFVGKTTVDDKRVGIRFTWSRITPTSAHWEQAYSYDDQSWEAVWMMDFYRAS
jgi:hypothetical protein